MGAKPRYTPFFTLHRNWCFVDFFPFLGHGVGLGLGLSRFVGGLLVFRGANEADARSGVGSGIFNRTINKHEINSVEKCGLHNL